MTPKNTRHNTTYPGKSRIHSIALGLISDFCLRYSAAVPFRTALSVSRQEIKSKPQARGFWQVTARNSVKTENGFTLVELLVMAPIVMITIVLLMSYLFNQFGQLTQQGALINLQVEAQNIVFSMQDDILLANEFSTELNSGLSDTYQPSGGWKYNSTPATLIVSTPALTANHRNPSRQPVYVNTEGCDASVIADNAPLYNNVIYFANGTNLYKRVVTAPSSMATCGTSFQKQSCPSANATTSCPADRLLTDKLNSMTLTYYDTNNTTVTNPEQANRVKVDLSLKDRAYAEDIFADSTITLKKLNR